MPNHKFQVGDMLIGNEKANRYSITSQGTIVTVYEFDRYRPDIIRVKTQQGSRFTVKAECFDLYFAPKETESAEEKAVWQSLVG